MRVEDFYINPPGVYAPGVVPGQQSRDFMPPQVPAAPASVFRGQARQLPQTFERVHTIGSGTTSGQPDLNTYPLQSSATTSQTREFSDDASSGGKRFSPAYAPTGSGGRYFDYGDMRKSSPSVAGSESRYLVPTRESDEEDNLADVEAPTLDSRQQHLNMEPTFTGRVPNVTPERRPRHHHRASSESLDAYRAASTSPRPQTGGKNGDGLIKAASPKVAVTDSRSQPAVATEAEKLQEQQQPPLAPEPTVLAGRPKPSQKQQPSAPLAPVPPTEERNLFADEKLLSLKQPQASTRVEKSFADFPSLAQPTAKLTWKDRPPLRLLSNRRRSDHLILTAWLVFRQ